MTTVEERREVARRLRETGEELGSSVLLWYHIAKHWRLNYERDICDV